MAQGKYSLMTILQCAVAVKSRWNVNHPESEKSVRIR